MHLAGSDKKGFTTDWGPVGFKKSKHPLSIMVRCEAISSFSHLFTFLVSRSLFLSPSFPSSLLSSSSLLLLSSLLPFPSLLPSLLLSPSLPPSLLYPSLPPFSLPLPLPLSLFLSPSSSLPLKVESQRIDLLKHPLVTSLLNYKWKTYGRYFYFGNLLIYIIFLLFLTAFALTVINPLEPICKRLDSSMN